MRTHSLVAATILTAAACQPAAPAVDLEAELAAIEARSAGVVAAESAMDTEAALAFWAPDAIVQPTGAPQVQGTEALREMYDQLWPQIAAFTSTTTATDIAASGDMAWEYGVNYITFASPEGEVVDVGKYIGVWRKIDGEWYLAAVAFSSDAPLPME